ncbi:hypothetical protein [Herbidospora mongoliensis]|uniref:hypothetical protein n=1 Tax=Herbidospora mongoliensis TaxID=688067 RepID=UPI00082C40A2|nr:hypothetical protein [Herbidospora mongoliensis]
MITHSKWRTSIAAALATLALVVLPAAPAHATYGPDQTVYVQLNATGTGQNLALLQGVVAFDDGNQRYRYTLSLCWQSGAYPQPSFLIVVNGSTTQSPVYTGMSSAPGCQFVYNYYSDTNFGGTVQNVRFDVTAGWFGNMGQYMMRTRSSGTYDNPYN